MKFSADYLLGRTYTFTNEPLFDRGFMVIRNYDVRIVGVDPSEQRVRIHAEDGSKGWLSFRTLEVLADAGALADSKGWK